ncbi:MAG TPA: glycosyltransferase family 2 protein, partial [Ktedonobacterales bacterium]
RGRFQAAWQRFCSDLDEQAQTSTEEVVTLAEHYEHAARWLAVVADDYEVLDHMDWFFTTHVLGRLSSDLALTGVALRGAVADHSASLTAERLTQLYRRLAWIFTVELESFERKRYVSLSHEVNKAMNLNSYIGLMGGRYRELLTPAGRALSPSEDHVDLVVPDRDYILTLDADSVVMPEYCLRLVHLLEQSHNADVAVAQTPYSSYPGASTRLERIAGATTDLQHIAHQGMTFHEATFWVGANAVLRKRALDDVMQTEWSGGWPIRRYIQDRTVIEDTESSIDLVTHGWQLSNYPERLSYSATPPDFGSLCIQRHRWANGGLLIVPKLWRYVRSNRARGERTTFAELFLRINYMASVFWSSISLLLLLTLRFNGRLLSPLVFVAAAPYFITMAMDLHYCGYKRLDVLRIYAFNLLLLPVNLAGASSSLVQGLTGAKGQFRRTPKVRQRTVPALVYIVLPYALVAISLYTLRRAYNEHLWADAVFAAANAALAVYAIVAFVGIRNSILDAWANILALLYKPEPSLRPKQPRRSAPASIPTPEVALSDWERILYFGSADPAHHSAPNGSAAALEGN